MTMNKDIKERWVKALRSGEYAQCQTRLHDENGFCCLGVLTDLYLKETNQNWNKHSIESGVYSFQDEIGLLHQNIYEWSGLWTHSPTVHAESLKRRQALSALNDNGNSFEQIATWIEKDTAL